MSSSSKDYGKALKALRERDMYELQLEQTGGAYEVFTAYLDWEETSTKGHVQIPRLTQMLFERALVTYWQHPKLWEDYAYYGVHFLPSLTPPSPFAFVGVNRC